MGRKRRPSSPSTVKQSPQSIGRPGTGTTPATRSRSRAASTAGGEELTWPPASASPADTAASAFLPNSPLPRMPYLLEYDSNGQLCQEEDQSLDPDQELMEPYWKVEQEYFDKLLAEIRKLPTLDSDTATSPDIIQESAADTILQASEFVLGLSSYITGELLRKCSGILMEWSKGTGTILTIAQLICSKSPNVDEWLGGDEYALNAEEKLLALIFRAI
ncbi:unnamed protein product [Miscanthus lutarioriparius]|uniref:Uncharacterized protein n=1 Tax=Miscanthus lutarioriparius TaxID=422564 RepID=A0A811RK55_9POAL|nr:unnamed protein product [Miscanthus lutarioriparius]